MAKKRMIHAINEALDEEMTSVIQASSSLAKMWRSASSATPAVCSKNTDLGACATHRSPRR